MIFRQSISTISFSRWIYQDNENKRLILIASIGSVIGFIWLKILYPYPNFMPPDSISYLEAADNNQYINIWAIGYSKFLRFISCFSNSHFVLVICQFLLLHLSLLYFLLSIRYLFIDAIWTFRLLFSVCFFNILLTHISNFISSDALFTALSLIWVTQLLWIIYNPTKRLIFLHAIILTFAFTVRYNALYYPLISILVIIFCESKMKLKLKGIALIISLLALFIGKTIYQYYVETKTIQFSAFGGWQLAANALYGYAYAPSDTESIPEKFRELHVLVNRHMDSIRYLKAKPYDEVGIYYLWDLKSPLIQYMRRQWHGDKSIKYFQLWSSVAPLYGQYGQFLIKRYPMLFTIHYLWPNFIKYYSPPTKFMSLYNLGDDTAAPIAVKWFGWKNNKLPTLFHDKNIVITKVSTILLPIINVIFILSCVGCATLGVFSSCLPYIKKGLYLIILIWLANMCFSVVSAPIELRYQLFTSTVTFVFSCLFIKCIINASRSGSKNITQNTSLKMKIKLE